MQALFGADATQLRILDGDVPSRSAGRRTERRKVAVEGEVVATARRLVDEHESVKAILLECSLLPPYAAAVQQAVNLPVFDYITMINYVFNAVVKQRYDGFI